MMTGKNKEMYDFLKEMLESSDTDNHQMALDIIDNFESEDIHFKYELNCLKIWFFFKREYGKQWKI